MGSIDRRIQELEERIGAEAPREPSEPFVHLRRILDELSALKQSCADQWTGEMKQTRVPGENIPRTVLGPGYTHPELAGLAVSRCVEAGDVPAHRAGAYLDYMRGMWERGGKAPDAVVEWERGERYGA